jgi:hypothetical protein
MKIFNENQAYEQNYAFPAEIQGLNYEIDKFFARSLGNIRILDL